MSEFFWGGLSLLLQTDLASICVCWMFSALLAGRLTSNVIIYYLGLCIPLLQISGFPTQQEAGPPRVSFAKFLHVVY